jgi:hypothetical protein
VSKQLSFNLLHNSLDYLLSAAEHAERQDARSLKYALLHFFAAVELALKARLHREHWSLIFADVDKATDDALRSGDFRSVDFETACKRLENISALSIDKLTLQRLDELRKLGNRVQRFAIEVGSEDVTSLLAIGCSFFVDFYRTELWEAMGVREEELLAAIHNHLSRFQEFVRKRLEAVKPELEGAHDLRDCRRCSREGYLSAPLRRPFFPLPQPLSMMSRTCCAVKGLWSVAKTLRWA